MKNIIEFLWGSPIITDTSDEDWLIVTDEPISKRPIPQLAQIKKRPDTTGVQLINFANFLYNQPFRGSIALFSSDYYYDQSVEDQVNNLISKRDQIVYMNLPAFYKDFLIHLNKEQQQLKYCYSNKKASKLIQDYIFINNFIKGKSFKEARDEGINIAAPVKLNLVPQSDALNFIQQYENEFNQQDIYNFFNKNPNKELFIYIQELINSINPIMLSGIAVKNNTCSN